MKTLQDEKAANEKSAHSARVGKNKETCAGGDPIVGVDGEGKPQKADVVVRMGEVVTNKKTSGCDSEKDAKRRDYPIAKST
jgi:hypothetical protein